MAEPEQEKDSCAICYDTMDESQQDIQQLTCNHKLHSVCWQEAMQYSRRCPLCRQQQPMPSGFNYNGSVGWWQERLRREQEREAEAAAAFFHEPQPDDPPAVADIRWQARHHGIQIPPYVRLDLQRWANNMPLTGPLVNFARTATGIWLINTINRVFEFHPTTIDSIEEVRNANTNATGFRLVLTNDNGSRIISIYGSEQV